MSNKILLVEDEAILALSETKMLEKHGYEVLTAYSGEKAVKVAESESDINLILMDIDLGRGMDGTEAAQKILKNHDLPIAFLSSHTEPEIVEKTEGITSYGYIVKNSGETVLLASIRMAFKLYAAHMELKTQKEHLRQALITQEHTEEELREKSDELDRYFTSSLDLLCIANTEGEFIRLNPEWERVLGYPITELKGRPFMDFVHEDDREVTLEALSRLDRQEEVFSFENRYRCKDGSYRWIEWRSRPQGDMIYAAARDITDRKMSELRLRESEEKFRTLMEQSIDMLFLHDLEGRIIDANDMAMKYTGYSREELLTMSIPELDPDYYKREDKGHFWQQMGYNEPFQFQVRLKRKDGSIFFAEVVLSKIVINNETVIMTLSRDITKRELESLLPVTRDITERKHAKQDRREKNLQFQQLFDSMNEGVAIYEASDNGEDFIFVDINRAGQRIGKIRKKDVIGKKVTEVFPGVVKMGLLDVLKEVHETGEPKSHPLIQYEDNRVSHWVENEVFRLPSGHVCAVYEDATEQYIAEGEYKTIIQTMMDGFWRTDEDGYFVEVNDAYCSMSGYSRDELLRMHIQDVEAVERLNDIQRRIRKIVEKGQDQFSSLHKRKDGTTYPVEVSTTFFSLGERTQFFGLVRDVSKQKTNEEKLCYQNALHKTLMDSPEVGLVVVGSDRKFVTYNRRFLELWNIPMDIDPEKIDDKAFQAVQRLYPDPERFIDQVHYYDDRPEMQCHDEFTLTDGRILELHSISLWGPNKEYYGRVWFYRDITTIKRTIEEKDLLMRELNHRVKNNLSMVSSLINLKEMELGGDTDLSDLRRQIEAIQIIHEKLYQGDNVTHIDMQEYISNILNSIFSFSPLQFEIVNNVEKISLETKTALSIGLIINEIATNALKYGFNSTDAPWFSVELKEEATEYSLVVTNNGNPFPEHIDFDNPETMGMYLVSSLVDQIDGSKELQKRPSPVFRIQFPKKEGAG